MSEIALSFSYNGTHDKSDRTIDPIQHLQMLIAAIDNANPSREHAVIVAAIGFDLWEMQSEDERMLAWEVYKRATIVTVRNRREDHQHGASWSIRMASEAAAAIGATYMIHLAEDILLANDAVDYFVERLATADYVGSWWGNSHHESVNTQLFGCRVASFADLLTRRFVTDPTNPAPHLEGQVWRGMQRFGLTIAVDDDGWGFPGKQLKELYFHSHDPDEFRIECIKRGVPWTRSLGCDMPLIEQFNSVASVPTDINEHCATLRGLAQQCHTVTEFGTRTGVSTTAFLASGVRVVKCYDIVLHPDAAALASIAGERMQFHLANTLDVEIAETDLLFIDTYHTYAQLKSELCLHGCKARKWIVMHDTTSYGQRGEDGGIGLWQAVEEFVQTNSEWRLKSRVHFNNGLTILERITSPIRK